MANPGTAGLALVEFRYTWANERVENRLHFNYQGGAIGAANLDDLVQDLFTWWDTNLKPVIAATCVLREIYAETYQGASSISDTRTVTSGAGTAAGASSPNNVALCLGFRSAFVGRSRRGRVYTPGITVDDWSGSFALQTYADDLIDAYNALNPAISSSDWIHVVASFIANGVPRESGFMTAVTQYVVTDLALDSQRRRLPERGE